MQMQNESSDFEFLPLFEAKNYRRALMKEFGRYLTGHVVEVGAGIGQMTAELRKLKTIERLDCIEPDANYVSKIKAQFPDQYVLRGTIFDAGKITPNAIISINVLEHIERDEEELKRYFALLQGTSGMLCLFVPAGKEIYAPIDKDFGHYRRYAKDEIIAKLTKAGFRIESARYFNFVGYFLWWLNFRILRQRKFNMLSVKLFDRLIFPLVYLAESVFVAPFIGQSIRIIARA